MKKTRHPQEAKKDLLDDLPDKLAITDEDIYQAMKEIEGYLDITSRDFRELYQLSYRHAIERVTLSVRAGDIMTGKVVAVEPAIPLVEVAARMAGASITGVPVVDEAGKVAGIISERDFLKHMGAENASFMAIVANCLRGNGCAAIGVRKGVARDIMSRPVITVREDTPLFEVAKIMSSNTINRLPVLDREEKITGMLTRHDLVRSQVL